MGSNPTPRTCTEPKEPIQFGLWLLRSGNRQSTVERKLRFLKALSGTPQQMISQVLASNWVDKSKPMALLTLRQGNGGLLFGLMVPASVVSAVAVQYLLGTSEAQAKVAAKAELEQLLGAYQNAQASQAQQVATAKAAATPTIVPPDATIL